MSIDWERLVKIIKKTKEKVIIATEDDLLVLLDLESYEKLLVGQADQLADLPDEKFDESMKKNTIPVVSKVMDDKTALSSEEKAKDVHLTAQPIKNNFSAISDVLAQRKPGQRPATDGIVDEEDEYFFEELDED